MSVVSAALSVGLCSDIPKKLSGLSTKGRLKSLIYAEVNIV